MMSPLWPHTETPAECPPQGGLLRMIGQVCAEVCSKGLLSTGQQRWQEAHPPEERLHGGGQFHFQTEVLPYSGARRETPWVRGLERGELSRDFLRLLGRPGSHQSSRGLYSIVRDQVQRVKSRGSGPEEEGSQVGSLTCGMADYTQQSPVMWSIMG